MVIKWNQSTGAISVTGPIENKVAAYGMLEAARDSIAGFHEQKAKSGGLIPVRGSLNGVN